MRLSLALVALLLLTSCGVASEHMEMVRDPAPAPLRLLVVGDSLSAGFYASSSSADYVSLLADSLGRRRSVSTTLVAKPGVTAVDASHWRLAIPSDDAVVELGTNDFGEGIALSTFAAAYGSVLAQVRRSSRRARIVCLSLWSGPTEVDSIGAYGSAYDAVIRDSCKAIHGRYVDLSSAFATPAYHGPAGARTPFGSGDWFHPNDAGHVAIARLILPALGVDVPIATPVPH